MKIFIKYFGRLSEKVGKDKEELAISQGEISSIIKKIDEEASGFREEVFAIFLNNKKVEELNIPLSDNDEICFMPPFAGG